MLLFPWLISPEKPHKKGDLRSLFGVLLGHIYFLLFAFFLPYGTTRWNPFGALFCQKGAPPFLTILPDGEKGRKKGR
jgi:hypothetical protein